MIFTNFKKIIIASLFIFTPVAVIAQESSAVVADSGDGSGNINVLIYPVILLASFQSTEHVPRMIYLTIEGEVQESVSWVVTPSYWERKIGGASVFNRLGADLGGRIYFNGQEHSGGYFQLMGGAYRIDYREEEYQRGSGDYILVDGSSEVVMALGYFGIKRAIGHITMDFNVGAGVVKTIGKGYHGDYGSGVVFPFMNPLVLDGNMAFGISF